MKSKPIDPWYSRTVARMSVYWDDEWARAYAISQSGSWRSAVRRAARNPFVFKPNHGPDAVQTTAVTENSRREAFQDLQGEDKLVGYLERREQLRNRA